MAQLVLGAATSHTSMLLVDPADLPRYREWDPRIPLLDFDGAPTTYEAELARHGDALEPRITPARLAAAHAEAREHVEHLADAILAAKLDALIIVGDDQNELYLPDNHPALLVYHGETIAALPYKAAPGRADWLVRASERQYSVEPRDFPVARDLAEQIIATLIDREFDVSAARQLSVGKGESHSIAFIHTQLLRNAPVPIVPVFLNAYFPPNQPTPARCYAVGQAIAEAVTALPGEMRIGIVASGGLSHFLVDEAFDQEIFRAIRAKDKAALTAIPRAKLNSGSSEIRNWICVAGALEALDVSWTGYVPGVRTPAGTGTGLGFALWG
ncbi:extradiol ring-cleavage dioxygenase [Hephaestia mangrovi]|uniref:DODA-type extradiol aromatic ring-opening family dioxygenase n=1 Tax=Hephaestia mangrovi TaxID=2873268 RepID=UPI001CA615F0|nr:extradiol ring-cleavage dioxygenase [Hephaestia mangrovi]MBY8829392.1 extradiol ring-cleavage dioxygenase [Hephaestia mangrovi]